MLLKYKKSKIWQSLPKWLTLERGFFGESWQKVHFDQIQARTIPPSFGAYLVDLVYRHKFGLPLIGVFAVTAMLFYTAEQILKAGYLSTLVSDSRTKGTFLLAILTTPSIIYTWFIRAHERTLSIQKEEDELWSKELNELINQAVDDEKSLALRLVAIRQMQDYLSGAKWKANQAANSSAILEAFSSIIDQIETKELQTDKSIRTQIILSEMKLKSKLLDVIGSVMRGALKIQTNGKRVLRVIGNNMSELNLSHLNLSEIDLSNLHLNRTRFIDSNLSNANCSNSNFEDSTLTKAYLYKANFSFANLAYADVREANFLKANIKKAVLNRANLSHASLVLADFRSVQFNLADINNADLRGADIRMASELNKAELQIARNWQDAYRDEHLACGEPIPVKVEDD